MFASCCRETSPGTCTMYGNSHQHVSIPKLPVCIAVSPAWRCQSICIWLLQPSILVAMICCIYCNICLQLDNNLLIILHAGLESWEIILFEPVHLAQLMITSATTVPLIASSSHCMPKAVSMWVRHVNMQISQSQFKQTRIYNLHVWVSEFVAQSQPKHSRTYIRSLGICSTFCWQNDVCWRITRSSGWASRLSYTHLPWEVASTWEMCRV